jgi:tRNA/rRNA methyltransferase
LDPKQPNAYKVFHSTCESLRKSLHIVLVRPESGGNVGSIARGLANMGIQGSFRIVGTPEILDKYARKMAVHAGPALDAIRFFPTLAEALAFERTPQTLVLAATARVGSAHRPHPLWVRPALERAIGKLKTGEASGLVMVFGPESDGLANEDVDLCDWVVTIPSSGEYRSLNLAQAVLVFSYEAHINLVEEAGSFRSGNDRPSQKERIIQHMIQLAEDVGFIFPGDPFKMRPRLEEILSVLPSHLKDAKTLHGLLDQISRTVKKGAVDYKGRFRQFAPKATPEEQRS